MHGNESAAPSPSGVSLGMSRVLWPDNHVAGGRFSPTRKDAADIGRACRRRVPTSKAPSGPTEATTLPAVVANTSTSGLISVTRTVSWAANAEQPINPKTNDLAIIVRSRMEDCRRVM